MNPEKCENGVVDETDVYRRRRCKITGYLCKPTVYGEYGKAECVFEPQYLNRAEVKQLIRIIEGLKLGMRVHWLYKMKSHTWKDKMQIHAASGTIREITEDGKILITPDNLNYTEHTTIHKIGRRIKLNKEELESLLQNSADELELEERIRKESGEE